MAIYIDDEEFNKLKYKEHLTKEKMAKRLGVSVSKVYKYQAARKKEENIKLEIQLWLNINAESKYKKDIISRMERGFNLNKIDAEKIYGKWRQEYMGLKIIC